MNASGFYRALQEKLSACGLPVWEANQAKHGAAWPCVTWRAAWTDLGSGGEVTVTAWFLEDYAGCAAMLDKLLSLFSPGGALLETPDGVAALWPERAEMVNDSVNEGLTGGRLRLKALWYGGNAKEAGAC